MDNIIEILLSQHKILIKKMADLKEEAEKPQFSSDVLNRLLADFKNILIEHINLENNVFYPELFKQMKNRGMDIVNAMEFVNKMKVIGNKVYKFLEKYAEASAIANNSANFKIDLNDIISILLIRIESEEDGIYLYWQS